MDEQFIEKFKENILSLADSLANLANMLYFEVYMHDHPDTEQGEQ